MSEGSRVSPTGQLDDSNSQQQVIVSLGELKTLEDEVIALRSTNQSLERNLQAEQKNAGNLAEFIDTLIALNAKQKEGLVERLEGARDKATKYRVWHNLSVSLAVKTTARQIALIQLLRGILRRHLRVWKRWLEKRKRAQIFARRCIGRKYLRSIRSCFESWKFFVPENKGRRVRLKLEKQSESLESQLREKERNLLKLKEETAEDLRSLQLEDERQQQDLREEVERLEGKLFEVEGLINDKEKEILDLRKERKKFILNTAQLDNEIAQMKSQLEELHRDKMDAETRMVAVKEDSDERSSYIKQLEKEVNDARVREIALKRRLRELERKDQDVTALGLYIDKVEGIPGLQKEAKEMKRRAVTLEIDLDNARKEVEALRARSDAAERKAERRSVRIDSLLKEKEDLETELARMEREVKLKEDAHHELEKDRDYFKYRVEEVRQQFDISVAKADRLERDLEMEKQRSAFFQSEILEKDKGLAAIVREACAGKDAELERRTAENRDLKFSVEEDKRLIAHLELDLDDFKEKYALLEKESKTLRTAFEEIKLELERKRREVEEERDRYRKNAAKGSMTVKKILQSGTEDGVELPSVAKSDDVETPVRQSALDLPLPPLQVNDATKVSWREYTPTATPRQKSDPRSAPFYERSPSLSVGSSPRSRRLKQRKDHGDVKNMLLQEAYGSDNNSPRGSKTSTSSMFSDVQTSRRELANSLSQLQTKSSRLREQSQSGNEFSYV